MSQPNTGVMPSLKSSVLWIVIPFCCGLLLLLGSFYLTIRSSTLYIKAEQADLFSHGLDEKIEEAGFSLCASGQNPRFFFRLFLGADQEREANADSYVLGRLPILVAVNFWNPVEEISVEQLSAIIKGELSSWKTLTGHNQRIRLVCAAECEEFLLSTFSLASLDVEWVADRRELLDTVSGDPGAIAILPWTSIEPRLKVLGIKTKKGVAHPFWSEDAEQDYPLTADVRLLSTTTTNIFLQVFKELQKPRINKLLRERFSSDRWLVGEDLSVLAAAGDLLFDRKVARTAKQKGDLKYPLLETAEIFRRADLAFANLECPLSTRGDQINMFRANPAVAEVLTFAGFDLVSLANNHIFDYGLVAFLDTIECLQERGIIPLGVGENIYEARTPRIVRVNGARVAFLAYTQIGPGFTYTRVPQHWAATIDLPGVAEARADYIRMDVAQAKAEADLVIVSFHWGNEYVHYPTDYQKAWGRTALAAGADLVIGHHPHVLQGIEFGDDAIIAYSLGNFVFDQVTYSRRQSLILQAAFDEYGLHQLRLVPILITEEQPRLAMGKVKQDILALVSRVSENKCEEEKE